ncbi:MAG: acyl-CoA dehydrogenase family protein, partial [Gammaproteobacteria bacterium]
MSQSDRQNPYSFDAFTAARDAVDYYADDAFLQRLVRHHAGADAAAIHESLLEFSPGPSFRWRDFAETIALPENRPWMMHYDGYGNRIDRIVRPRETERLQREIFGAGIFSAATPPWERLGKLLLAHQNGEHGVMCAMACTEGMIALLEAHLDGAAAEVERAWRHCKEGIDGDFGTGSQFLTEIQGGSDVPANLVEAVPDGDRYRLYGVKFFCSACHTDYAIVTAKVTGSEDVSTFLVPAWLTDEDRLHERRNGYRIRRLKRKLGTIELPTAEIEYDGAIAWPVGPIGRGVANVVGYVLTTSRINVSIGNVASDLRAAREARLYAQFREVFGRRLIEYPAALGDVEDLERAAQRSAAGLFRIYGELIDLDWQLTAGLPKDEDLSLRRRKFRLRLLIMLQKITTTKDTIDHLHRSMSMFAGHGVMECFSAL